MAGSVLAVSLAAGSRLPSAAGVFYTDISARVLLISAVGVYAVFTGIFRAAAAHGLRGECLAVQLCVLGKTVRLTALRDTGNALRDGNGASGAGGGAGQPFPCCRRI